MSGGSIYAAWYSGKSGQVAVVEGENESRKRATSREFLGSSDVDGGLRFWRALRKGPAASVSLCVLLPPLLESYGVCQ